MIIKTQQQPAVPLLATDSTDASFTDQIATLTKPVGAGVINFVSNKVSGTGDITMNSKDGPVAPNSLILKPYGTGADDTTFLMRVWAWYSTSDPNGGSATLLWVPMLLGEFTCTLSTKVGVAASDVDNTHRFCDLIILTASTGTPGVSNEVVSPGNNDPGHIVLDMKGAMIVSVKFNINSSATAANVLVGRM